MSSEYTIKLPIFEGPLDLLLHLIKINEMEITEISISQITSQYLETLRLMETLDLEVAGDFLVMAATLLNIKLRSILPEPEEEIEEGEQEEAGDDYLTARALMQRLIEYRRFKEAAQALGGMAERQALIFVREVALPALNQAQADPGVRGDLGLLLEAFARVIKFVQRRDYHEVAGEEFNVDDKIDLVRRRVLLEERIDVDELFRQCQGKVEMIVTLLALLELTRLKELRISQIDCYGNIMAYSRRSDSDAPGEDTAQEAVALQAQEADIMANRTGLVDNSAPPEDEEDALLDALLGEGSAEQEAVSAEQGAGSAEMDGALPGEGAEADGADLAESAEILGISSNGAEDDIDETDAEVEAEWEPETEGEMEAEAECASETELETETEPETEDLAAAEPEPEMVMDTVTDAAEIATAEPEPEIEPEAEEITATEIETEAIAEMDADAEEELVTEVEPVSEVEPAAEMEAVAEAGAVTEAEPEVINDFSNSGALTTEEEKSEHEQEQEHEDEEPAGEDACATVPAGEDACAMVSCPWDDEAAAGVLEMEEPEGGGEILAPDDDEPMSDGRDGAVVDFTGDMAVEAEGAETDETLRNGGARIIDLTAETSPGAPGPEENP